MGRLFAFFVLVLVAVHAIHARNVPGDVSLDSQQITMPDSSKEQTSQANAPKADSPKGNGIDDKKNFIYGGVGSFTGMGGYAGVASGIPLLGGLGGAAGIGGYKGIGGLGGLGGAGGLGVGAGGVGGLGGGSSLGVAGGSGILPSP
ncbi:hypothetical protein CRYUN_Cryun21dG0096500 [Craigia yunnanensis]